MLPTGSKVPTSTPPSSTAWRAHAAAEPRDFLFSTLEFFLASRYQSNVRARPCKRDRHGSTQPAAGVRHQRRLALQTLRLVRRLARLVPPPSCACEHHNLA